MYAKLFSDTANSLAYMADALHDFVLIDKS